MRKKAQDVKAGIGVAGATTAGLTVVTAGLSAPAANLGGYRVIKR